MVWGFIFKGGKWVMKTRKAVKKKKTKKKTPKRGSITVQPKKGWNEPKKKTLKEKLKNL